MGAETNGSLQNGWHMQIKSSVGSQCLGNKVSIRRLNFKIFETRSGLKLIKTEIQPGHNKIHDRIKLISPSSDLSNEQIRKTIPVEK